MSISCMQHPKTLLDTKTYLVRDVNQRVIKPAPLLYLRQRVFDVRRLELACISSIVFVPVQAIFNVEKKEGIY